MTPETKSTAPDDPIDIQSADDLQETATEYDIVLADFYADWCGPCKMMEPVLETIAADTDAAIAKVDVDRLQQLAGDYGVQGVPTLVLFSGGEPVEKMVGAQTEEQLRGLIADLAE